MIKTVYLYRVGRNLNRAVRTCAAFGVKEIGLIDCNSYVSGNLFSSQDAVKISVATLESCSKKCLALRIGAKPIQQLDSRDFSSIIIGGETSGLPRINCVSAGIVTPGVEKTLTVEAALAIALFWSSVC